MLFDWGVESGVWRSPSSFIKDALPWDTLFGLALPLPDADHALHHVACLFELKSHKPLYIYRLYIYIYICIYIYITFGLFNHVEAQPLDDDKDSLNIKFAYFFYIFT